jgi:hypothetical protein
VVRVGQESAMICPILLSQNNLFCLQRLKDDGEPSSIVENVLCSSISFGYFVLIVIVGLVAE